MLNEKEFYEKTHSLRKRFLQVFSDLGFGHVTTAFSETEILTMLFYNIMNVSENGKDRNDRDRFVISKGHGAGMLFPIFEDLAMLGDDSLEKLLQIGQDSRRLQSLYYPGFSFYGGSLGLGLGMAAGLALGAKMARKPWLTFCLLGDAECCEGSIWEAFLFAGKNQLNNLIAVIDRNYLGCSDFTENMIGLDFMEEKVRNFGWECRTVNGHSYEELTETFSTLRSFHTGKPLCIVADTVKGKGLEYLCNRPLMHGYMPKGEETVRALEELQ